MSNSQDLKEAMHNLCEDKSVKAAMEKVDKYVLTFKNVHELIKMYESIKDNRALIKAERFHEKYIKSGIAPNHATKRLWSVGELYNYFHTGDKALIFAYKASDFLAKLDKYTPIAKSLVHIFNGFKQDSEATGNFTGNKLKSSKSNATIMREKFKDAYNKMGIAVKAAKELSFYAPPGVDDYIGFICDAYEKMGVAVELVDNYCKKIEDMLNDKDFKSATENMYGKKSRFTSGENAIKFNDLEQGLDSVLGKPSKH